MDPLHEIRIKKKDNSISVSGWNQTMNIKSMKVFKGTYNFFSKLYLCSDNVRCEIEDYIEF
jgi:hypothetical protein